MGSGIISKNYHNSHAKMIHVPLAIWFSKLGKVTDFILLPDCIKHVVIGLFHEILIFEDHSISGGKKNLPAHLVVPLFCVYNIWPSNFCSTKCTEIGWGTQLSKYNRFFSHGVFLIGWLHRQTNRSFIFHAELLIKAHNEVDFDFFFSLKKIHWFN